MKATGYNVNLHTFAITLEPQFGAERSAAQQQISITTKIFHHAKMYHAIKVFPWQIQVIYP